jgi:hypothetical protein
MGADAQRRPLGLLALETVFRLKKSIGTKAWTPDQRIGESDRWLRSVQAAEEQLAGRVEAIHVMDREGDQYSVLAGMAETKRFFVIRSFQDRRLEGEDEARLRAVASAAKVTLRREVPLSPRPRLFGPKGERHPARRHRIARLSFAAASVELKRTAEARASKAPSLRVNVIHVFERKAPNGEPAVEWFLLTNLPVDTPEAIAFAVDCYRARWTIEEFFKALKTGCQFEKRQLETAHGLLNALAILAPVAWRLLLLRHLARADRNAPATAALTGKQLEVLRAVAKTPLSKRVSAREAMLAVAALGGHLKSNGDPGWLVLGRGMHDLLCSSSAGAPEKGRRCDQSLESRLERFSMALKAVVAGRNPVRDVGGGVRGRGRLGTGFVWPGHIEGDAHGRPPFAPRPGPSGSPRS